MLHREATLKGARWNCTSVYGSATRHLEPDSGALTDANNYLYHWPILALTPTRTSNLGTYEGADGP